MAFGIRLCTVMFAIAALGASCSSSKGGAEGTAGSSGQADSTSGSTGAGGTTASSSAASSSAPASTAGAGGQSRSSAVVGGSTGEAGRSASGGGKDSAGGTAGAGAKAGAGGTSTGGPGGAGGNASTGTTNDTGVVKDGGAGADSGGSDKSAVKPSAGCGKTPTLKKSTPPPNSKITYNQITSAGLSRKYILWYPDNYDKTKPYRLIMNYHWYSGSASQVFDCSTEGINCYTTQTPFFGLINLAENSTIFVAPDGIDAGWANTNGRDTTLTDDILKQVEDDLCIDTNRIFAQGFSYGGAMSATLGCQRAEVFRGVVVFAGGIGSGGCTGKTPIAYYGATGTQDSGYKSGQTAVTHFAEVNGCTSQTLPTPPSGGHTCISFASCSAGYPVRWCPFDDIHTPSPRDRGAGSTWQPKEVWTFLTQF